MLVLWCKATRPHGQDFDLVGDHQTTRRQFKVPADISAPPNLAGEAALESTASSSKAVSPRYGFLFLLFFRLGLKQIGGRSGSQLQEFFCGWDPTCEPETNMDIVGLGVQENALARIANYR